MGGKFKFHVQDSDLEYLFWQCEKHIALSEKKPPLVIALMNLLCNENLNSFLTRLRKLFKGGNYSRKYGISVENIKANDIYFSFHPMPTQRVKSHREGKTHISFLWARQSGQIFLAEYFWAIKSPYDQIGMFD
jgi:hypothetical protein